MIQAQINPLVFILLIAVAAVTIFFAARRMRPDRALIGPAPQDRRGMPIMWNALIIAVLAIAVVSLAVLADTLLANLSEIAWGAITSILTMLTFAFSELVKTNIHLIRSQAERSGTSEPLRQPDDDPGGEISL